jgi:hypothetical protein
MSVRPSDECRGLLRLPMRSISTPKLSVTIVFEAHRVARMVIGTSDGVAGG